MSCTQIKTKLCSRRIKHQFLRRLCIHRRITHNRHILRRRTAFQIKLEQSDFFAGFVREII